MTPPPLPPQLAAMLKQAMALHGQGQIAQARDLYRQILQVAPKDIDTLYSLGAAECQLGNLEAGIEVLGQLIALDPAQPEVLYNRGTAQLELGRHAEALASFEAALALRPGDAGTWVNRGNALRKLERLDDALMSYDQALAIQPGLAEAHFNRGNLLHQMKRPEEALASYDRALALQPGHAEALRGRGDILQALNRLDEALADFDRAMAIYERLPPGLPGSEWLPGQRLYTQMSLSDWSQFHERRTQMIAGIERGERAVVPFHLQALIDSPALHQKAARIFATAEVPAVSPVPPKYARHERLRVAYVSSDFTNHPVGHLIAALLEHHDRTRFEVFAFSSGPPTDDAWRKRIREAVDHFIDISGMPDQEAIALARQHEIDIAVDLNGFTQDRRTGFFAGRAAPIQLSYLGYLGTMEAACIDYLIADATIIPENEKEFYSEKIIYLPSYQINDDRLTPSPEPVSRAQFGLPETAFVFCSFNHNYKLTPDTFDSWMRILDRVPDSVLWLHVNAPTAMHNIRKEAARRGIDPGRIIFAERVPLEKHLARQSLADLFLDTHPYNAGATASNALRMGPPVITCAGQSFPARYGASLLTAMGLPEMITTTVEDYEKRAVELATDPARFAVIRQKLRDALPTCALFDTLASTRAIEAAYMAAYDRHQNGLPPEDIWIRPPAGE